MTWELSLHYISRRQGTYRKTTHDIKKEKDMKGKGVDYMIITFPIHRFPLPTLQSTPYHIFHKLSTLSSEPRDLS